MTNYEALQLFGLALDRPNPTSYAERRAYTLGFETAADQSMTTQITSDYVPAADRPWYALGVYDGKAGRERRATWSKNEPPQTAEAPSSTAAWVGGAAVVFGLGLIVAGLRRRPRKRNG